MVDDQPTRFTIWSRPVLGWALYDFASTIFSFTVVAGYFNEWVIEQQGRPDWHVAVMGCVVGLLLVVVMPVTGALSDVVGKRLPFLGAFTATSACAAAVMGVVDSVSVAIVLAGVVIFCLEIALSMYDPLLATVAPPEHHGTVSGLGVGAGYVGVLIGSLCLALLVPEGRNQAAFLPMAAIFGALAIPIFLWVRERPRRRGDAPVDVADAVHRAVAQLVRTAGHVRREQRAVGRFLLARFLYVDAIVTVISYMMVYMDRVGGFSGPRKMTVLALGMGCAALGALVVGRLVELHGPKRVLVVLLVLVSVSLSAAAATGSAGLVWVLGPVVGIGLGGVWTSDRVLMVRLTPEDLRGEYFGLYHLVGKLSSGVGPLVLWAGTIWVLHDLANSTVLVASRAALAMLALATVAGLLVLRPLSDRPR